MAARGHQPDATSIHEVFVASNSTNLAVVAPGQMPDERGCRDLPGTQGTAAADRAGRDSVLCVRTDNNRVARIDTVRFPTGKGILVHVTVWPLPG
ncbi:hypothetical protein [Embleya sp. NPDC020630]|uniref:hypothetical protein n=1 Tax=Embleya sp. NPDC020630 TaxID=3363979 RepID=UPI003788BE75